MTAAIDTRLEATISEPDLASRLGYWRDSIPLIRDFPVLGIGLGGFQDLFPRYQSPPWSPLSVREAHNDYLELAADTGLLGAALLLWFGLSATIRICRGLRTAPPEVLPVVGALMVGLGAIAFQELSDFALQIPANAVLFAIFLALAMRLAGGVRPDGSETKYTPLQLRRFAAGASAAAVVLIVLALGQERTPYPYLSAQPRDTAAARKLILEHPARATPHLWYAALTRTSAAARMKEIAIAAELEPINPLILDRYAQALAAGGRTQSALDQLTRSILVAPSIADHFYLQPGLIEWLSLDERKAIDRGFRMAVARGFDGAAQALAAFYAAVHHDAEQADVLARASSSTAWPDHRAQLLLEAGAAYLRADEAAQAAAAFQRAAQIEPSNPGPYQYLAAEIFAPRKDLDAAKAALNQGLAAGADPFALYLSLAQVYEQAGDLSGAEAALLDATWSRPGGRYDYDTLMRLADLERRAKHLDRAALWMRRAIAMRPGAPEALYQLALVEEADYEYGQALRDLEQAMRLAPDNAEIGNHYRDLRRLIADARKAQQ